MSITASLRDLTSLTDQVIVNVNDLFNFVLFRSIAQ